MFSSIFLMRNWHTYTVHAASYYTHNNTFPPYNVACGCYWRRRERRNNNINLNIFTIFESRKRIYILLNGGTCFGRGKLLFCRMHEEKVVSSSSYWKIVFFLMTTKTLKSLYMWCDSLSLYKLAIRQEKQI